MTTDPTVSAGATDEVDLEVPEADRAEQQQPAAPDTENVAPPPSGQADVEASEGDLVDQSIEVPLDEDDDR